MNDTGSRSFEVVHQFLERFYRPQPNNDRAATAAVTAYTGRFAESWELAVALRDVLDGTWPPDSLMNLVDDSSGRLMDDDGEARRFLEMVYDDNALEIAFDPEDI